MIFQTMQQSNHLIVLYLFGYLPHGSTYSLSKSIHWIIEKAREFQKNLCFCFIDYAKALDCVDHNKLENSERDGNTRPPWLASWETYMQVRKQQFELDMEQQTGSK